jgi:parallel beta-helix repeat protein
MTNNIYQNNGIQKIRVNGGTITEDAFWENPAIPYHIRSSISIKSEMKGIPTLTLESGNTLEFGYGIQMFIGSDGKGGRLVAQGTENSPIVFTAFDRQNRWYGIDFGQQMGEPSILQYCELSYGGLHSLIKCFNASPQIDHCSIDNSAGYGYGVWIEGNSAPEIAFCDIYDNVWGIWHVSSENTVVENCNIHQNSEYGIYCSYGEPEILQCNIYDNKIGIHSRSSALPIVNNCNIFGNSEFGVQNYGSISINAENNWWGSTTGPYDPNDLDGLYNPDGKGDCVSDVIHDYVDYEPYLTSGPHIFSEDEGATAANNSKKIQVEDEKVHYVWSSGGNVYYNWAQKTNELIWAGKKEVGPGIWPALDVHSDTINISWVSKHNPIDGDWQNSIYYANFIDEAFSGIFELYKGDPGVIIHPPAFLVIGDSGHVVIESYRVVQIDDPDAFIADWKIRYGNFQMDNPIITDWTTIDETVELLSEIPKTTPSMCEYDGNLSLVWSGVDGEIYYKERASEGWTEKQNLSNSTEPSWTPSINSNGPMLFCFWEEGEDPEDIFYCMKKADTWSSAEQVIQTPGRSVLPFFTEGTFLTWADSLDTGWEIFLKRRNFNGTWEDDEIISNTPGVKSLYPHCAYTEILINGYLYTIWTEGNDTPYEVKSKLMEAKPTPITFSGHISTNTTWYRDVYLIGDVIVDIGATLTINPGVKIYVKPHDDDQRGGIDTSLVEIIVEGGLVANGTYADSIIITSASDAPIAGDWWGIRFLDSSDDEASDLRFCRVDYGCIGVSCEFSSPVIKRCNFRDNAFLIGQRPQWPYPRPFYCLLGAGILCFESQAVIDSNLVIHNGWSELPLAKGINTDSLDSGIHCVYSSVTFTNNVVEDNNGGISSWGDNGSYYGSNQVIGNGTGGFGISGKALIENNTIEAAAVGSSVGISIYLIWEDEKTKVTVRGNTIDCHVSGIVSLLSPLGPGMQPESLLVFVSGNVIENNKAGISVSEGGENVFYRYILTKNYIISNDSIGVIVFGNPVSQGSNPVILGDIENMNPSDNGENHIYDNLGFDVVNEHPEELHAQGNFWGTTNEIEIDNRIYDDNENPSFGMVDFSGYYVAGEISQGETWRNIVSIGGDILVPEGITLTIEEGTLIRFASNCDMGNIGVDEERAELIVEGNLEIKNVTKEYGDLDIAASPWIEHISVTQEEDRNTRRNEVHEISNPHKDRCKYPEENIDRPPSINPVIFTSDAFEPKPSDWYGIELGGLNIEGRKKGQSGSRRSIAVIDGDARGVRDIHDCYVRYAARGLVLCEGEALSMKGCTFANNKVGLKIKELSEITVKECVFRENTEFGIFAGPTVTGTIKDDTVSGNGTGIALTGDASCDIKNVILQGNATGLHLAGTSYPTMKENIIINSADFGVYIMDDAHPDLGGNGRNCIYGSGQFDLYNGTDNDIMAKKNYWGTMDLDTIAKHIYDYYDDNSLGEVKIIPIWDGDRGLSGAMSSGKGEMPLVYSLKRVNPNPFDNIATIHYSIAKPGNVSLCIYDVSGRLVKTLCDERKDAGSYSVRWDSRDNMNRKVSAGVYFIRMETGNFISTKKALLVR